MNYDGITPFVLNKNSLYLYYRGDMRRDNPNSEVPYFIVRYKNNQNHSQNQWQKLVFNKDQNAWIDAGSRSDMTINPGDMLQYTHANTYSFTLTATKYAYSVREVTVLPDFNNFQIQSSLAQPSYPVSSVSIPIQILDPNVPADEATLVTIGNVSTDYLGMPTMPFTVSASFHNQTSTVTTVMSTITSVQVNYYTFTNEAPNFVLNVPLNGWNYATASYDGVSLGARPIWVYASDKDDDHTKRKGIDIWSGSPVLIDDYNFITQPPYSNMVFNTNGYIEYNRRRNTPTFIVWKQPVVITVNEISKKWCEVISDTNGITNLSAVLYNNINDLIVSATNTPSNIVLDIVQDKPLLINYYARDAFTWSQVVSNSSLGLPPTGGVWVPIVSGDLVVPSAPYAHLSNRHYPTHATVPSITDIYTAKDSGGYYVPRMLGVSTAISKDITNVLDTSRINNDQSKRGVTAIYRDLEIYYPDRGLSNTDQFTPVRHVATDSTWMKASITEGQKAGTIVESNVYQELMPYQTKFETIKSNDNGVYRQGNDSYDPWFGTEDITWENPTDWPANWRSQYNVDGWYAQLDKGNLQMYQWKTDIFGNQYALLKDASFQYASIYDKKHSMQGALWTRNLRNIVQPATVSMKEVFIDNFRPPEVAATNALSATNGVLDFDVWFDTMMLYTSSGLWFYHLNFDYENDRIYSTADEINSITTTDSVFGGTWFFEQDKKVTICTLLSCGDQIRPILRSLDLDTNELTVIYDKETIYTNMSAVNFVTLDHPVLTYDYKAKVYNVSYLAYTDSAVLSGMFLNTINIKDSGNEHDIISAKTIRPKA